ncbi:hypothetical protein Taro_042847, partial [Colocasia esculenta]|nr:hypothetical protein [Colocasia esculenta]
APLLPVSSCSRLLDHQCSSTRIATSAASAHHLGTRLQPPRPASHLHQLVRLHTSGCAAPSSASGYSLLHTHGRWSPMVPAASRSGLSRSSLGQPDLGAAPLAATAHGIQPPAAARQHTWRSSSSARASTASTPGAIALPPGPAAHTVHRLAPDAPSRATLDLGASSPIHLAQLSRAPSAISGSHKPPPSPPDPLAHPNPLGPELCQITPGLLCMLHEASTCFQLGKKSNKIFNRIRWDWGRVEEFLATGEAGDPHTKPFFFPVVSAAICIDHHLEVDQGALVSTLLELVSTHCPNIVQK